MNTPDLCPQCFASVAGAGICRACDADPSALRRESPFFLPYRTVLATRYQVGEILGRGGFAVTYLAYDQLLKTRVAIKEYLPTDLVNRGHDGLSVLPYDDQHRELFNYGVTKFLKEARRLEALDHLCVVKVHDFFEENGTAYLAMKYIDGCTLYEYVSQQPGEVVDEAVARSLMTPILDALRTEVHPKGLLHRDISSQNIYVTKDGTPILLDFGAAKQALGERSHTLQAILKPGYSPPEQYDNRTQGAWTDIYACAATMYWMVTRRLPPVAPERTVSDALIDPRELTPELSATLSEALKAGLAVEPRDRPQSVEEFQQLLTARRRPRHGRPPWRGLPRLAFAGIVVFLSLVGLARIVGFARDFYRPPTVTFQSPPSASSPRASPSISPPPVPPPPVWPDEPGYYTLRTARAGDPVRVSAFRRVAGDIENEPSSPEDLAGWCFQRDVPTEARVTREDLGWCGGPPDVFAPSAPARYFTRLPVRRGDPIWRRLVRRVRGSDANSPSRWEQLKTQCFRRDLDEGTPLTWKDVVPCGRQ